jgi:Flp pilus assembly pilin Flp
MLSNRTGSRTERFARFLHCERGATSIEYAGMLGMIAVAAAGGVMLLGGGMNNMFLGVGSAEGGAGTASGSSGTSAPAVKTLFSDSFGDPRASVAKWKFDSSLWTVSGGELHVGPTTNWYGSMIAAVENCTCQNGTVSFDANMSQGAGYGVFFRLQADAVTGGPINGYCFQYDEGYPGFVLRKWVNGLEINPPIAVTKVPANYTWLDVERKIQVTTVGSEITALVDGVVVMSVSDNTYASGGVGLRLWNQPGTSFDNFTVTTP